MAVLISSYTRFLINPLIVQGVIVCLYVIQFTRYRRAFRSRGQLSHFITSNPICQALFWIFLTFFVLLCIVLLPSWTACLCYHNTAHLSIPFFTFLDNSFQPLHAFPSDYLQEAEHTKIQQKICHPAGRWGLNIGSTQHAHRSRRDTERRDIEGYPNLCDFLKSSQAQNEVKQMCDQKASIVTCHPVYRQQEIEEGHVHSRGENII